MIGRRSIHLCRTSALRPLAAFLFLYERTNTRNGKRLIVCFLFVRLISHSFFHFIDIDEANVKKSADAFRFFPRNRVVIESFALLDQDVGTAVACRTSPTSSDEIRTDPHHSVLLRVLHSRSVAESVPSVRFSLEVKGRDSDILVRCSSIQNSRCTNQRACCQFSLDWISRRRRHLPLRLETFEKRRHV